jgi:hypothetical protein
MLFRRKTFDPVIKLLCLANVGYTLYSNVIKTFDPFGSSYLGQANELFKMEQKNGSLYM